MVASRTLIRKDFNELSETDLDFLRDVVAWYTEFKNVKFNLSFLTEMEQSLFRVNSDEPVNFLDISNQTVTIVNAVMQIIMANIKPKSSSFLSIVKLPEEKFAIQFQQILSALIFYKLCRRDLNYTSSQIGTYCIPNVSQVTNMLKSPCFQRDIILKVWEASGGTSTPIFQSWLNNGSSFFVSKNENLLNFGLLLQIDMVALAGLIVDGYIVNQAKRLRITRSSLNKHLIAHDTDPRSGGMCYFDMDTGKPFFPPEGFTDGDISLSCMNPTDPKLVAPETILGGKKKKRHGRKITKKSQSKSKSKSKSKCRSKSKSKSKSKCRSKSKSKCRSKRRSTKRYQR